MVVSEDFIARRIRHGLTIRGHPSDYSKNISASLAKSLSGSYPIELKEIALIIKEIAKELIDKENC